MNNDERMLGLDPSKYKKEAWNPADYIKGDGIMAKAMQQAVEDMKARAALQQEQEQLLGPEPAAMPDQGLQRKQLLMRSMGIKDDDEYQQREQAAQVYRDPKKQNLIKELGMQRDPMGFPVVDPDDEMKLEEALQKGPAKVDRRSQMIYELLTNGGK